MARIKALLVNPSFPDTYWSLSHALPLMGRRWLVPPLPLITVAALLPDNWECELIDLAVQELSDEQICGADVVLLTGMLVQRHSLHEVLARCDRLGIPTVVGGPYATAMPERLPVATHLVLGEAEETIAEFAADFEKSSARRVYKAVERPDVHRSPVPRYELLDPTCYQFMSLQFSRGCPFQCEFCDIISLYGRVPRTKRPEQVIAELEAIVATGFQGRVLFVDDNFIGNKKAVRAVLEEIARWRRETRAPIDFFTEASIDLADRPDLVKAMTDAGFAVVFIGVETPSAASLKETKKNQNLRRDMVSQIRVLREQGLDIWAGFILGFDSDESDIFDSMIEFVEKAGVAFAMVGQLMALPGTPLYERLEREGRLRPDSETGDMFDVTNVVTRLPAHEMLDGYARVLETLYSPERYFARCLEHLGYWKQAPGLIPVVSWDKLKVLARSLWHQGVESSYRKEYWRFISRVALRHPEKLPLAFAQALGGHHFIHYTVDTVVPRLREAAGRAERSTDTPPPMPTAGGADRSLHVLR